MFLLAKPLNLSAAACTIYRGKGQGEGGAHWQCIMPRMQYGDGIVSHLSDAVHKDHDFFLEALGRIRESADVTETKGRVDALSWDHRVEIALQREGRMSLALERVQQVVCHEDGVSIRAPHPCSRK